MCVAIPSKVIAIDGFKATVECFGKVRDVHTNMMTEEVELGDYLIVQAGNIAINKTTEEDALETLKLFEEVFGLDALMQGIDAQ